MDALRPRLPGMDPAEQRAALLAIYDESEAGPPVWGESRSAELFSTGAGVLELFRVALRQYQPGLSVDDVLVIAESTSPEQYEALQRAFFWMSSIDEVEQLLGLDDVTAGPRPSWVQVIVEAATNASCRPCDLYGLTLREFAAIRSGGKRRDRGIAVQPGMSLAETVAKARAKFVGVQPQGGSHGG
jgi:hypothetical protein